MFRTFLILVVIFISADARKFNNPVVPNADNPDPGVLLYNGKYYVVTTTWNTLPDKNKLYTSTDLQNWNFEGYVFNETTIPPFSFIEGEFWAPELHYINNRFYLYFTAHDRAVNRLGIAVATSDNPLGPYIAEPRPVLLDTSVEQDFIDSTIINDNGVLYLIWHGRSWIYGALLTQDGFRLETGETYQLFRNDLAWEDEVIEGPYVVKRNNYFYMFYSGNRFCSDRYAIGVARSQYPLGPYEKLGDPILVSDDEFKGPGHCSIVKDVDGATDVMLYHAYTADEVCGPQRLMMAATVLWGADGWPYIE